MAGVSGGGGASLAIENIKDFISLEISRISSHWKYMEIFLKNSINNSKDFFALKILRISCPWKY